MSFFRSRDKHKKERKGQKDPQGSLQRSHQLNVGLQIENPRLYWGPGGAHPVCRGHPQAGKLCRMLTLPTAPWKHTVWVSTGRRSFGATQSCCPTAEGTAHKPPPIDAAQEQGAL